MILRTGTLKCHTVRHSDNFHRNDNTNKKFIAVDRYEFSNVQICLIINSITFTILQIIIFKVKLAICLLTKCQNTFHIKHAGWTNFKFVQYKANLYMVIPIPEKLSRIF